MAGTEPDVTGVADDLEALAVYTEADVDASVAHWDVDGEEESAGLLDTARAVAPEPRAAGGGHTRGAMIRGKARAERLLLTLLELAEADEKEES